MLCKNHPDRTTKRRCFQCKDPICPACTSRLDGHFFCSEVCHELTAAATPAAKAGAKKKNKKRKAPPKKRAAAMAAPQPWQPPNEALPPALTPVLQEVLPDSRPATRVAPPKAEPGEDTRSRAPMVFKQQNDPAQRTWLATAVLINVIVLTMVGILIWRTEKRAGQPSPEAGWTYLADLNKILRTATTPATAPEISEAPLETTAASLVIEGLATGDPATVRLLLNGKETSPLERDGSHFKSPPLPLDFGINVVQVSAESEAGEPVRYSLAKLIRRLDVPPTVEQTALPLKLHLPPAPDITRGNPTRNAVSFTFDGGSEANAAKEILDILRQQGVRTTLFLTGQFIQRNADVVRTALVDGHEIANHTFNHPHLTTFEENSRHDLRPTVTRESFQKQLLDTAAEFQKLTGQTMAPFWRAPFGEVNSQLRVWAEELGYRHIGWTTHVGNVRTLDSLDWVDDKDSRLYLSGRALKTRFVNLIDQETDGIRGGIFLMHLGTDRKTDKIHWQLASILSEYKNKGFQVVPISQLLQ